MQEPGEWYEYRLRDSSDTLSFRASPRPGPESQVSFVVYGDMGESDHARAKAPGYIFIMLHQCIVCLLQGMCVSMIQSCCNVAMLAAAQSMSQGRYSAYFLPSTHLSKTLAALHNAAQTKTQCF